MKKNWREEIDRAFVENKPIADLMEEVFQEGREDVLGMPVEEVKPKSVTQIIEEVCNDMCNNYCRYTSESREHMDDNEVYEICDKCPLNRLN